MPTWPIHVPSTPAPANTTALAKPIDKVLNLIARGGFYSVPDTAGLAALLTALAAAGEAAPSADKPVYADQNDTQTLWRNAGTGWVAIAAPWTAYTPTLGGITLGNGSLASRMSISGGVLEVSGKITFGSTTAVTGTVTVSTPLTLATGSGSIPLGTAQYTDVSASLTLPGLATVFSSGAITLSTQGGAAVSASAPFAWAAGDLLGWRARCELA